jgi:hypothetical protein
MNATLKTARFRFVTATTGVYWQHVTATTGVYWLNVTATTGVYCQHVTAITGVYCQHVTATTGALVGLWKPVTLIIQQTLRFGINSERVLRYLVANPFAYDRLQLSAFPHDRSHDLAVRDRSLAT